MRGRLVRALLAAAVAGLLGGGSAAASSDQAFGYRPMTQGQTLEVGQELQLNPDGSTSVLTRSRTEAVSWNGILTMLVATTGGYLQGPDNGYKPVNPLPDGGVLDSVGRTSNSWRELQYTIEQRARAREADDPVLARLNAQGPDADISGVWGAPVVPDAIVEPGVRNPDGSVYPPAAADALGAPAAPYPMLGATRIDPLSWYETTTQLTWNVGVPKVQPVWDKNAGRWVWPGVEVYRNRKVVPLGNGQSALVYVGDYAFVDDVRLPRDPAGGTPTPTPTPEGAGTATPTPPGTPGARATPTPPPPGTDERPALPTLLPRPTPPAKPVGLPYPNCEVPPLPSQPLGPAVGRDPDPQAPDYDLWYPASAFPGCPTIDQLAWDPPVGIVRDPVVFTVHAQPPPLTNSYARIESGPVYRWDFGDGQWDLGPQVEHTFMKTNWWMMTTQGDARYDPGYPVRVWANWRISYAVWDVFHYPEWSKWEKVGTRTETQCSGRDRWDENGVQVSARTCRDVTVDVYDWVRQPARWVNYANVRWYSKVRVSAVLERPVEVRAIMSVLVGPNVVFPGDEQR